MVERSVGLTSIGLGSPNYDGRQMDTLAAPFRIKHSDKRAKIVSQEVKRMINILNVQVIQMDEVEEQTALQ